VKAFDAGLPFELLEGTSWKDEAQIEARIAEVSGVLDKIRATEVSRQLSTMTKPQAGNATAGNPSQGQSLQNLEAAMKRSILGGN